MTPFPTPHYGAHCCVTHVLGQLVRKWIPLPPARYESTLMFQENDFESSHDLQHWSRQDWSDFLNHSLQREDYKTPWKQAWHKQTYFKLEKVAQQLRLQFLSALDYGAHYVPFGDGRYPAALRFLTDPPAALTLQGSLALTERPAVAIIGARKATAFSFSQAQLLGSLAAQMGVVVVSGGALGCDIAAHKGVLAAGLGVAPAIVVMPCGLKLRVPMSNRSVFSDLQRSGALFVSERLWDAVAMPHDFRGRNRIIAGLSMAIVLVHAHERSGAMMTVSKGLEEGRDIFVLKVPECDVRYEGNQRLLAEGAQGFETRDEFLSMVQSSLAHYG